MADTRALVRAVRVGDGTAVDALARRVGPAGWRSLLASTVDHGASETIIHVALQAEFALVWRPAPSELEAALAVRHRILRTLLRGAGDPVAAQYCPVVDAAHYRLMRSMRLLLARLAPSSLRACLTERNTYGQTILHVASQAKAAGVATRVLLGGGAATLQTVGAHIDVRLPLGRGGGDETESEPAAATLADLDRAIGVADLAAILDAGLRRAQLGGAWLNEADGRGLAPLHHSCRAGRAAAVAMLVAHGASVDAKEAESGATCGHLAAARGHDGALLAWARAAHGAAAAAGAVDEAADGAVDGAAEAAVEAAGLAALTDAYGRTVADCSALHAAQLHAAVEVAVDEAVEVAVEVAVDEAVEAEGGEVVESRPDGNGRSDAGCSSGGGVRGKCDSSGGGGGGGGGGGDGGEGLEDGCQVRAFSPSVRQAGGGVAISRGASAVASEGCGMAPSEGNQAPSEGNRAPSEGNRAPSEGKGAPSEGNRAPSEGNRAPSVDAGGWRAPSFIGLDGLSDPPSSFAHPPIGHVAIVDAHSLTRVAFVRQYESLGQPVLLRNATTAWAALDSASPRRWTRRYLSRHAAGRLPVTVAAMPYQQGQSSTRGGGGGGRAAVSVAPMTTTLAAFLELMGAPPAPTPPPGTAPPSASASAHAASASASVSASASASASAHAANVSRALRPPPFVFDSGRLLQSTGLDLDVRPHPSPLHVDVQGAGGVALSQLSVSPPLAGAHPHVHGSAYNALIVGVRRWALVPPASAAFRLQPALEHFLHLRHGDRHGDRQGVPPAAPRPPPWLEVRQSASDVLYLPSQWQHATLSLAESVAVAVEFV